MVGSFGRSDQFRNTRNAWKRYEYHTDFWLEKVKGRGNLGYVGTYALLERSSVCVCALDLPLYEIFTVKDSWV